jgi:DNA-binding transcriptional LysR family regulator
MALFVNVVNAMSFTRAAERLGMPKSSLSRRIAELERAIGVRLLNRTTRHIELTEAGAAYHARCTEIVEAAEVAHEELADLIRTPRGHLRVSMLPDMAVVFFAPLLAIFSRRHPLITFELDLSPRRVDLLSEGFDLAIRAGDLADSSMTARRLALIESRLYAAPDYLAAHGTPTHPAELADHACLRLPLGAAGGLWRFSRGSEIVEVAVNGAFAVNHMGMVRRLAEQGLGIGFIHQGMARDAVTAGTLVPLLADWSLPATPIYAFTASRLLPAKVRTFVDFLAAALPSATNNAVDG